MDEILKNIRYSIVLALCLTNFMNAQFSDLKFDRLNVDDGLSENTVNAIIRDHKGFLWFGTYGGLSRYDGSQFKIFYFSSKDSNSINNNAIKVLFGDSNNNLWIGCYNGGLNKYNKEKENFTHFPNPLYDPAVGHLENILSISEDSRGILWIGTEGGLASFDPAKNEYIETDYSFVKGADDQLKREIFATFIVYENNLLIGTISEL